MRFLPIDQTRGLAIFAMILAHFGPGFWERLGLEGPVLDGLLLIGRFATPTFIAIFGFTLAFAYLDRARTNPKAVRAKLFSRSYLVLLAAVVVAIPEIVTTLQFQEYWGGSILLNLFLDLYGVLLFYTFAIFFAGLFISFLAQSPYVVPAIMGALAIFIGTILGYDAWPSQGQSVAEIIRLYLVSGKYAFFTNFGMALMLASLGWHMKSLLKAGVALGPILLAIGSVLLLLALSMGRVVGWRTFSQLHSGYDAPPQLWYLLMVAGVMLIIMGVLDRVRIPFVSAFLEHTGRNPLSIYVSHAFVLPGVSLLRFAFPTLPQAVHIAVPLAIFLLYWAFIISKSIRVASPGRVGRN